MKPVESRPSNKSLSKSASKRRPEVNPLRDLKQPQQLRPAKLKNKTKSNSNCHSNQRPSKDATNNRLTQREQPPKHNLYIHNRRPAASQDRLEKSNSKPKLERFFRRKNQQQPENRRSSSRKDSKRSTDNENEETLIERLKAENEYYREAFLSSRESQDRLERRLEEERLKRSNEKEWFKYQITNLRRQLTADKLQLAHIFAFDSPRPRDISDMIVETDNEASSLIQPHPPEQPELDCPSALSELSIDSK